MLPAFFLGMYEFLSAPSARRATRVEVGVRVEDPISIHALLAEGDSTPRPRPKPVL